ncbi:hypothetical protein [Weissella viridescens]|nr:hypothetical protein [Weissella viridescens]
MSILTDYWIPLAMLAFGGIVSLGLKLAGKYLIYKALKDQEKQQH